MNNIISNFEESFETFAKSNKKQKKRIRVSFFNENEERIFFLDEVTWVQEDEKTLCIDNGGIVEFPIEKKAFQYMSLEISNNHRQFRLFNIDIKQQYRSILSVYLKLKW